VGGGLDEPSLGGVQVNDPEVLPATLFGDDPAGLGGDVTAPFGGGAAA